MLPLTFIALVVPSLEGTVDGRCGSGRWDCRLPGDGVSAPHRLARGRDRWHCHRDARGKGAAMNMWLTIIVAGLLTFATRLSFIYLVGRRTMPHWFMRGLRFVPVAVLSAIIVPETLTWQGTTSLTWRNPQLWAAIVAILVGLPRQERPAHHRGGHGCVRRVPVVARADLILETGFLRRNLVSCDLSRNRVGGGDEPPPLTPPDMRVRIRRFVKHYAVGDSAR